MEKILCCSKCYRDLKSNNDKLPELWVKLCFYYKTEGVFEINEMIMPNALSFLRTLEQKGYISTMDGELIQVKVHGENIIEYGDEDLYSYCINFDNHFV